MFKTVDAKLSIAMKTNSVKKHEPKLKKLKNRQNTEIALIEVKPQESEPTIEDVE